ncbi:MAG TPA: PIG-L family deacetylase [Kineosporiaceae bacterium]
MEQPGPDDGTLETLADGLVLLRTPPQGQDAGARGPVEGSATWSWTPPATLPGLSADARRVDVFYTPHPDDETLSMGVLIAAATSRGDRVIVVCLTDGRTSGAIRDINARLAADHDAPALTADDLGQARDGELRRATGALGVHPDDVVLAHLDAPGSDGGAIVTVAEAEQVVRFFAARYPGATHTTMSDVAERQQDHLDAGVALHRLLDAHVVTSAQWTVSRLWWSLPGPRWTWALPSTPAERESVRRAGIEYQTWDPRDREFAVGFYSVRWQFAALGRDVRDRVHGTGPTSSGILATVPMTPTRAARAVTRTRVTARVTAGTAGTRSGRRARRTGRTTG